MPRGSARRLILAANYNLTSNDMTHRGFRIGRLAPALFTYFLSLPVVQAVFPTWRVPKQTNLWV